MPCNLWRVLIFSEALKRQKRWVLNYLTIASKIKLQSNCFHRNNLMNKNKTIWGSTNIQSSDPTGWIVSKSVKCFCTSKPNGAFSVVCSHFPQEKAALDASYKCLLSLNPEPRGKYAKRSCGNLALWISFPFGRWRLSDLLAKTNLFSLRSKYLMTSEVGIQNKEVIIEPIARGDKTQQPFIRLKRVFESKCWGLSFAFTCTLIHCPFQSVAHK